MTSASARRHMVAVLAFSPVALFELAVPFEVFGTDRTEMGVPSYDVRLVAGNGDPLLTPFGFELAKTAALSTLRRADTIVVPGWGLPNDQRPDEHVLGEIRRAHRRGARIVSLCSGAFVLAAAGLLDGRCATTHWMYTNEFSRMYPLVELQSSVLYVQDGTVFTSAGTAAAIDLCLNLLRSDHGAEVANIVARRMVIPPHREGGQAQYVETPMVTSCADDTLAATLAWATEHLDHEHTVESLARRAQQSPRTFARRFRATTGTTPLQWLLNQRVVHAQRMLETSDQSVELVAVACGFSTASALREHFVRRTGVSPHAYRQTFRQSA
ncbi:MAG: bacterial regulatory helix-turn-helix, AraC family protein [Ilumatobacteraceae bacterium]|nr:bacterial regulatory helix-turn-helix, AraC family protein [Ilumatobacteraceae bacterium]